MKDFYDVITEFKTTGKCVPQFSRRLVWGQIEDRTVYEFFGLVTQDTVQCSIAGDNPASLRLDANGNFQTLLKYSLEEIIAPFFFMLVV